MKFALSIAKVAKLKFNFGLWQRRNRELENNMNNFKTCVLNPFRGQNMFLVAKSRGPLIAGAPLNRLSNAYDCSIKVDLCRAIKISNPLNTYFV